MVCPIILKTVKVRFLYGLSVSISKVACSEKGDKTIFQPDFTVPSAIMMGSEEKGISAAYLNLNYE